MSAKESLIIFEIANEQLIGVVSHPIDPQPIAVLIIVGGPQYRVGSHRQFVLLARKLAEEGFPVMRFDYRGMGDSTGDARTFEHIEEDIEGAINALVRCCPTSKSIVLWGLCDAASAAMMSGWADSRIKGMVLLNPWVRSEATLARTYLRHYYLSRLVDPSFWRKLISGAFSPWPAAKSLLQNVSRAILSSPLRSATNRPRTFQSRMMEGLEKFSGQVLLILSGRDLTAQEFTQWVDARPEWRSAISDPRVSTESLPSADHTFSSEQDRSDVERLTVSWIANTLLAQEK